MIPFLVFSPGYSFSIPIFLSFFFSFLSCKENLHVASTISEKKITFVNQVFNAIDILYVHVHAHRIVFTSDQTNAQTKIEHITWELRDIKSIVSFTIVRLVRCPRSSAVSRFLSRKVRQQCVSRGTRFPRRVPRRNETRISRTSCPLYAGITWAVRSVNIHVKKTSVLLKVECKLIKRIKDSKSYTAVPLRVNIRFVRFFDN